MSIRKSLQRLSFDDDVRQRTWRKLAAQLKHDVGLEYALSVMRDRFEERKSFLLAGVFEDILRGLRNGESLDVALRDYVPPEELMLIRGGYLSAKLESSLTLCAKLIDARKAISRAVVSAIAYPLLLITMLVVVLIVIALHVMPTLTMLVDPSTFTGPAAILHNVSLLVASQYGLVLLVFLIVTIALIFISLPKWTGKSRLLVEGVPPWSIYRLIVGTMWLFTVSTSLQADIPLVQIMDDMLKNKISPWLRERVEAIRLQYTQGKNFGRVLVDTGLHFPDPTMVDDILVYSTLPTFETILHALADEWLENGIARVKTQSTIVNTTLLVCIMGVMCCIGMAVISIQQQLSANLGAV
ncbi:MAG: type II secretion system F family protein [Pseudomonadota bacterium]